MTPDFEHSLSLPATPVRIRVGASFFARLFSLVYFHFLRFFTFFPFFFFFFFFFPSFPLRSFFRTCYLLETGGGFSCRGDDSDGLYISLSWTGLVALIGSSPRYARDVQLANLLKR